MTDLTSPHPVPVVLTPASASLQLGDSPPLDLYFSPAPSHDITPGSTALILGYTAGGQPVKLTTTSLEWLRDLVSAGVAAEAQGIVQAAMERIVP